MGQKFYRFWCGLIRPIYAVLYPADVSGVENVPEEGACLVCANHISNRDPF